METILIVSIIFFFLSILVWIAKIRTEEKGGLYKATASKFPKSALLKKYYVIRFFYWLKEDASAIFFIWGAGFIIIWFFMITSQR